MSFPKYHVGKNIVDTELKIQPRKLGLKCDEQPNSHVTDFQYGVSGNIAEMARNDEGIRIETTRSVGVDFDNIVDGKTGLYIDSNSTRTEIFYNVIFRNNVSDINMVGNAQSNSSQNLYDNNQCSKSNPPEMCQGGSSAQSDRLNEALKRRAGG